jgi:hypothetical protein
MIRRLALAVSVILIAACSDDANDSAGTSESTVTSTEVAGATTTTESDLEPVTTTTPTTTESDFEPITTTTPTTTQTDSLDGVFSFADDDLCEWIDADTVSAIVADAYTAHGATPVVTGFEQSWDSDAYAGCWWSVESADPNDPPLASAGLILTEPLDVAISMGHVFAEHPALSDGVRVNQAAELPVGEYGNFLCGMEVRLSVEGHAETMEFWHCVPPDFDGDADAVLSIADGLLQAMGWVPVQDR